jgi:sugar lactone lactonase YvrE
VIRKITAAGVVSAFAGNGKRGHVDGPPSVAEFNVPIRMGADSKGNIYIGDTGDSRVRKITPDGIVSTVAGTGVFGYSDGPAMQAQFSNDIRGICVDNAGYLYVVDAGNHRVRQVSPDGIVSTLFEFTDPDQTPANMKVDQTGNLYLSDREHNRIYRLTIKRSR